MSPDKSSPPSHSAEAPFIDRRDFLKTSGLTGAMLLAGQFPVMAGPFTREDFDKLIPENKKLSQEWMRSLVAPGEAPVWKGSQLKYIGMPCNGMTTGQVYLSGDGRLYNWRQLDAPIYNGVNRGPLYKYPDEALSTLPIQGAAVRVTVDGETVTRELSQDAFPNVVFEPEWPMGHATFDADDFPVKVRVTGWAPFIPGNMADSSLPVSVLSYQIINKSDKPVEAELVVWLENVLGNTSPVGFHPQRNTKVISKSGENPMVHLTMDVPTDASEREKETRLFTDFEFDDWSAAGWVAEGEAFGKGPLALSEADFGALKVPTGYEGQRVTSSRRGSSDVPAGTLTSPEFKIELPAINFLIHGDAAPQCCMELIIDGKVIKRIAGENRATGAFSPRHLNVTEFIGKTARLRLVDVGDGPGEFSNVLVDRIEFSTHAHNVAESRYKTRPTKMPPEKMDTDEVAETAQGKVLIEVSELSELSSYGDMAIMVLAESGFARVASSSELEGLFATTGMEHESALPARPCAIVGAKASLESKESMEADAVLAWRFRKSYSEDQNHYATLWEDAPAVLEELAPRLDELHADTKKWVKNWYRNTTLPSWLMQRSIVTANCMQTETAFRLSSHGGNFFIYEGNNCCPGSCTHVMHYAQALGYLFPEIERLNRTTELEYGLRENGDLRQRWHGPGSSNAVDGTCGTILRIWREHKMSADDSFLKDSWPGVKKTINRLINHYDSDKDGIFSGKLHNTLDAPWSGQISWLSSMYVAALQAGVAMADELGEEPFARGCRNIARRGSKNMVERLFDEKLGYFVMKPHEGQKKTVSITTGCHIDQVLGQNWVEQLGLASVFPEEETRSALESLWKYNFTPDVGAYRKTFTDGRWYAVAGDAGLIMATFPNGGAHAVLGPGKVPHSKYLNECMTGFEWQAASHMLRHGMVTEGLSVGKAIYDRYNPERRNPFNEIECGSHYTRAMASYGIFLSACGYHYDGPKGKLAFAPRVRPTDFRAPFTVAEGWGSFAQKLTGRGQTAELQMLHGRLSLNELELKFIGGYIPSRVEVVLGDSPVEALLVSEGTDVTVTFKDGVALNAGERLSVNLSIS